jgi:hypothetical protein
MWCGVSLWLWLDGQSAGEGVDIHVCTCHTAGTTACQERGEVLLLAQHTFGCGLCWSGRLVWHLSVALQEPPLAACNSSWLPAVLARRQ